MEEKLERNKKDENICYEEGKITIIVPIYNTEKYIEKCINSIINQTYTNLEIILIDDGSTDNSGNICDNYALKDNRIKVVHKKNEGVSIARNIGIEKASGEYVGFVDSDDYIESTMYEVLIKDIIENQTDIAVCNCSVNGNSKFEKNILNRHEMLDLILDKDKFRGYVCNKIYKLKLLKNLRFEENIHLCEDLLFNCNYIARSEKMSIIDRKLYNYVKRDDSAVNSFVEKHFSVIEAYQKIENIYEKYSEKNLLKLQKAYLKQCTFLKYYIFVGNYNPKYKGIVNTEAKRLIKIINKNSIGIKEKMLLNIYYMFPILIGKLREIKYR